MEELDAREMLEALRFMDAIAFSYDMDALLRNSVEFLVQSTHAANCAVLLDGKTTRFYSNPASDSVYARIENRLLAHIKDSRSAIVIRSVVQEAELRGIPGLDHVARSLIAAPIPSSNGFQATLFLYSEKDLRHWLDMLSVILPRFGRAIGAVKRYESVQRTALTDALTGMYNRMYLNVALRQEIAKAKELKRPTSVIIFDVDDFKRFNDSHGHLEGDKTLQQVARISKQHVEPAGIACRYGGEEFVLVLPECAPEPAKRQAEDLRKAIETQSPLTVSIGLVTCLNSSADPESMLKEADRALYKAKAAGKNAVVNFLIVDKSLATVDCEEDAKMRKE